MTQDDRPWYRARTRHAIGSAVQDIRRASDVNQTLLARKIGSSRPTISRMERGEAVSVDTVLDALAALGYEIVVVPRGRMIRVEEPS